MDDKLVRLSDVIEATRKPRLTDAELRMRLSHIPAVDAVEVRHARWLRLKDGVFCGWCTFGWKFMTGVPGNVESEYRYCPNCGARMDGRREDGDGDG